MRWVRHAQVACMLLSSALSLVLCDAAQAQASAKPDAIPVREHRPTVKLTLPKALALAMEHNRHLLLAGLAVADAEEKKNILRSDYYPHIRNESTALHVTALEGVVVPAGAFSQASTTGLIPPETLNLGQGAQDTFTSGTGLIQPITQLLKVHAGVKAACADIHIAKLEATDAEDSIALLVHKLYYEMLTKQLQLNAADESVKASTVEEEESTQAVEAGKSLDVARLENRAASLQQEQASITDQIAINDLMMQFDDVLGLPLGTKLQLDADSLGEEPVLPSDDEAVASLRKRNPKVLSAEQTVEKAKAAVSAAKDAYIPDLSGIARYSYQSGIPFLVHNFGTFGGVLSYDLFDGGAREAKLKQAKIQLHMAEVQLDQTQSDVSVQVYAAYDQIRKLQQLIQVASETLLVRQEQARVVQERLNENAALASEVARSQANLASAKASVLEAKLGLFLLQKQVLTILGERPN
ncbi:MAG TPA: TolC family protein [Acidisarcina sp.]